MEKEISQEFIEERNKSEIKRFTEKHYSAITSYLVDKEASFPHCCETACSLLHYGIKKDLNLNIKICHGIYQNISKNERCNKHTCLEYSNLIIDPTDYQFEVIDLWSLPLKEENYLPKNIDKKVIHNQKKLHKIFMKTYIENAFKRYQEKPNEKEKYFILLKDLRKNKQITPEIFTDELKRCFKAKIFYKKNDPNFIYTPNPR